MSNRNFDNRVIIQRLQNQNYARNLFTNNANGKQLINNPQNTDGTASNQNTFTSGAQTMYFRGLLGGGETINIGGTFGLPVKDVVTSSTPEPPTPEPPTMIINISTVSNGQTMNLPFDGITSLNVDWGDGLISSYTTPTISRTYTNKGVYKIEIGGAASRYGTGTDGSYTGASLISSVTQWGTLGFSSLSFAFYNATNLLGVPSTIPSSVRDISGMFYAASAFNQYLNNWSTSNVTNMSNMFYDARAFNQPLNNWNTLNVTYMNRMFTNAYAFNQPLNNWSTSNVSTMSNMFANASAFNQTLNNWTTSSVTYMTFMFYDARAFNQPLNNWNTSNVTSMVAMFTNAYAFNQSLNNWSTSNVTNMALMFTNAYVFNSSINNWNTSSVTNMNNMFGNAYAFNQNISGWNTSSVTNMTDMFIGASSFNQDISGWSTSRVSAAQAAQRIFCYSPLSTISNASKRPVIAYPGYVSSCS